MIHSHKTVSVVLDAALRRFCPQLVTRTKEKRKKTGKGGRETTKSRSKVSMTKERERERSTRKNSPLPETARWPISVKPGGRYRLSRRKQHFVLRESESLLSFSARIHRVGRLEWPPLLPSFFPRRSRVFPFPFPLCTPVSLFPQRGKSPIYASILSAFLGVLLGRA